MTISFGEVQELPPHLNVSWVSWVYGAFTLAKHLSVTEQNATVAAGKFLQLNPGRSPNYELRLYKLTKGQNRENHFLPQLKAKRIVQKITQTKPDLDTPSLSPNLLFSLPI